LGVEHNVINDQGAQVNAQVWVVLAI
jgi:hypothetical protein